MNNDKPRILFDGRGASLTPDCDCACGVEYPAYASSLPLTGRWQATNPAYTQAIEKEQWQIHYTPTGAVPITVVNRTAERIRKALHSPKLPEEVAQSAKHPLADVRAAMVQMAQAGLIYPAERPSPWIEPRSTTLTAWLYLTQQCNLRCPYCYVPHRGKSMTQEVAHTTVTRLVQMAQRHHYRRLKLKYAGGEPTLNFDLLQSTHQLAEQMAQQAHIELDGVVLSNGTLWTEHMLDFIHQHHLRLSLSLDGGANTHDRLRVFPNGRGSFGDIMSTIERAQARNIPITLSITVTAWNLAGLGDAVAIAMERAIPFNLNFVRERQPKPWVPKAEALVQAVRSAFDVISQHLDRYPHTLANILDRARFDHPHLHTCSAGRDYLAIRPDGAVSACQMEVDTPLSHIQADDPLAEVRQRGATTFTPTVDEQANCASCPWRYACGGGCPLLRGSKIHRDYCSVYRQLYPELVRLEGLRLIRQYSGQSA